MSDKEFSEIKSSLHPRNKHRENYNFKILIKATPDLAPFIHTNAYGNLSIDFFSSEAVRTLNKALLKYFYGIGHWQIPKGYLTPPIPGRAEYIHQIADLITSSTKSKNIKCLDIGVGANCIYPLIGISEYDWSFVGADIDQKALENAEKIREANPKIGEKLELRLQKESQCIFRNIIRSDDFFHLTICNPPFHKSAKEAQAGSKRKIKNLSGQKVKVATLNFGGQSNELWCEGEFVKKMILESIEYSKNCTWFTTLVSREEYLPGYKMLLKKAGAKEISIIDMNLGNKKSRILAWSFKS